MTLDVKVPVAGALVAAHKLALAKLAADERDPQKAHLLRACLAELAK